MISIHTLQSHATLIWVLFLAPVFLVLIRGYVLDRRFEAVGVCSRYSPLLYLCWVPGLGLLVALLCYARWTYEHLSEIPRYGYLNHCATW